MATAGDRHSSGEKNNKRLRSTLAEARVLLADAGVFERGFDFTAALTRTRDAAALLASLPASFNELPGVVDLAAEIEAEAVHFKQNELAGRREIVERSATYVAREVAALR